MGAALLATTPLAPAPDPLGCDALVFDPGQELDAAAVTAAATATASALGADLRVRAEGNLDGGLDARMAQLDAQCPGWSAEGIRKLDLVVVLYSSAEREASVFYGPAQAYLLEFRWEHAVDEMGARLAAGDYTGGVLAGLDALRRNPPATYEPAADPTPFGDTSRGASGVPGVIWLALAVVVITAVVRVGRFLTTGEWDAGGEEDDHDAGWGSSRRSSRWRSSSSTRRSFSSRSSRARASGARRSSSTRRSTGRSGGGTKKW